jgi:capsular exopolysaccharide synthesis family protein
MPVNSEDVEQHLITLIAPTSFESEQYRILGHRIEQMHKDANLQVLAISSPTMGDGKTTTAINLAGTLASTPGSHILLVEMDLRRPTMHEYLGLRHANQGGIVDAILDPALSLKDVVLHYPPFNLSFLLAGQALTSPYDVLKLPRVGELLAEVRQRYDVVIVDTPPLIPLADCRFIEQWVDGFLLIVSAHKTPRKLLEDAVHVVDSSKLIGLIFNKDEHIGHGYYSYYSYAASTPEKPRSSPRR